MKCDELKVRTVYVDWKGGNICYYDPYEVDAAIAELKAENERLKNEKKKMYTKLQHDTIIDAMSRSHHKELRATKRALWLARAERALTEAERNRTLENGWRMFRGDYEKAKEYSNIATKWDGVERKCRAKAKQYK